MSRYQRSLQLFSVLVLVLVAFGLRLPVAQAAGTFVVTTTLDLNTAPPACDGNLPPPLGTGAALSVGARSTAISTDWREQSSARSSSSSGTPC